MAVAAVVTGMVPSDRISIQAPVSEAFRSAGLPWAAGLVAAGALAGISSVLLIIMLSLPRILMALGRDRLLPASVFGAIHPRFRTPWLATIADGVVIALLASLLPLRVLADVVTAATLLTFIVVAVALLVLRRRPGAGPFRARFGPLVRHHHRRLRAAGGLGAPHQLAAPCGLARPRRGRLPDVWQATEQPDGFGGTLMRIRSSPAQIRQAGEATAGDPAWSASRQLLEEGKAPSEMFQTLAVRPDILTALSGLGTSVYPGGLLEPALKERVVVETSRLNDCQYCVGSHLGTLRRMGLESTPLEEPHAPA